MGDLLSEGLAWLAEELLAHCSRTVIYHRAATGTDTTAFAIPGKSQVEIVDAGQSAIITIDRDFLIRTADLIDDGQPFLPQPGDIITDGPHTFEVLAIPGSDCYTYATDDLLRIHTKRL